MHRAGLLTAFLLVLPGLCTTMQKRAPTDHGWERLSPAPRDGPIKLHVAVRQEDGGAAIERQLVLASSPGSAHFRQHVSANHATHLSAPAPESVREVAAWLSQHGMLQNAAESGGIFEIGTTIGHAETLLNTSYFVFSDGVREIHRAELYHLPGTVAECVDFVTPSTSFPSAADVRHADSAQLQLLATHAQSLPKRQSNSTDCSGPDDLATPTCIRSAYDISFEGLNYTAEPNRTTFAVYATGGASLNNTDLQQYLRQYNPPAAEANASYSVIGPGDTASPGGIAPEFETALTTSALLGLAYPEVSNAVLYNYGGVFGPETGATYDNFVMFLQQLISNETVPHVVSIAESANERLLDPDYARRLCNMMAQVGARGVSLLFSVGNNGPNGDGAGGEHKTVFEPRFPATCPWITAVGGTTNIGDEQAATKETIPLASSLGFTSGGGGFSNLFTRPQYQSEIRNYLKDFIPESYSTESGFNASGRGYPDVAAFSTQYPTVVDGFELPIGGTSAAVTTWAAIVSLLNDYESFHGRPPLGFLNPWLYSLNGTGLKDIVKGGNNVGGCSAQQGCNLPRVLGYNVTEGWDAVTGLGSPKFRELIGALDGDRAAPDEEFESVVSSATASATSTPTTNPPTMSPTASASTQSAAAGVMRPRISAEVAALLLFAMGLFTSV